MGKRDFPYYKELLIRERIHSLWEQILSLEVPILKRDTIEENPCYFQYSPVDVCNFFSNLATLLIPSRFPFHMPHMGSSSL